LYHLHGTWTPVNSALSVGQSVTFYSPISKSQLKTFEHMNAKSSPKCKSGEIITDHINPEIVFRRALVLTSFSNCCTRSDLQNFLIVPSSWNMDTGIGPTGCEECCQSWHHLCY
jgi:hypothetical protein